MWKKRRVLCISIEFDDVVGVVMEPDLLDVLKRSKFLMVQNFLSSDSSIGQRDTCEKECKEVQIASATTSKKRGKIIITDGTRDFCNFLIKMQIAPEFCLTHRIFRS